MSDALTIALAVIAGGLASCAVSLVAILMVLRDLRTILHAAYHERRDFWS